MRSQMVVLTPLLFDQDLRFIEREEEFAVQQVVLQLAVEERTGLVVLCWRQKTALSGVFLPRADWMPTWR